MQLFIKYHVKDIEKIQQKKGSDWIDLRAAETVIMKTGENHLISLGISIKLPDNYDAHVVPRSSTFKTWGILQTNHFGVIDSSYSGENDIWRFPAYATRDCIVVKGDRICQFRIAEKQPEIEFLEVEYMTDASRGGFGSTGIK